MYFSLSLPDDPRVTLGSLPVNGLHAATSCNGPELDGTVKGTTHDACVIKLQTGDSVLVPSQCHHAVTSERPQLQVVTCA